MLGYERLTTPNRALLKAGAMILGIGYSGAFTDKFKLRNSLPEPFDYAQHVGNVFVGAVIGSTIANITAFLYHRLSSQKELSRRHIRSTAAAYATLVSLAVNAAFETRTGIKLLHIGESFAGTPDFIDLAYGVGSSTIAGAIAPTFRNEHPNPSFVSDVNNMPPLQPPHDS